MNTYNASKEISVIYDKNNNISPDSNIPWVIFDGKKPVFKPMQLSKYLKENRNEKFNFLVVKKERGKKSIFIYNNGVYRLIDDDEFKGFIRKFVPQDLRTKKTIDEVYADLITDSCFVSEDLINTNENYINFQDGLLNLTSMQLEPHSYKMYSTIQIPANYKEVESCTKESPVFDSYLDTLCSNDEDKKEVLLRCVGLCISNIYGFRTKKALFLVGKGDSGKSQIKSLTERLIGIENISTADIKTINERFGKMALYGKRLVGCNDMSYETVQDLDIFKQATGGDRISIEFKNDGFITYLYKGFIWFNCNKLPSFGGDKGKWVYDRMIPIICDNVVPEEKRDKFLLDKMMKEKNSIIKKALAALKRLINDDFKFNITDEMKETLSKYEIENNTLFSFIEECCESSANTKVKTKRSTFNECYKRWCKLYNNNKGILGNNTIKTMLKDKYGETFKLSGGIYYMDKLVVKDNMQKDLGIYDGNQRAGEVFEDFKETKSVSIVKTQKEKDNDNINKILNTENVNYFQEKL